jgi:hypothetical protein
MSRSLAPVLFLCMTAASASLDAQDRPAVTAEEALANARTSWTVTDPEPEIDPCDDPDADEDTIIVCRQFESGERYMFERPVRADTEVTGSGAPRPPDFDESCLRTRGRENCMMFGSVPPPAIMVDFDAIPETPAGSDAARLYGGPTDADVPADANATSKAADLAGRTLRGLDDDVIGP